MVVTISVNVLPCTPSNGDTSSCEGPINGTRPTGVDILDAYYHSIHDVYTSDFPNRPPVAFNFTELEPEPPVAFYVVGGGFGNFDEGKDPDTYNLVDPPCQNTVSVPTGGWAAIRFRATNPGA
nr:unnamed protein product [Digitaria exilis]